MMRRTLGIIMLGVSSWCMAIVFLIGLVGCNIEQPPQGIPKLPPLFGRGDKVRITDNSPAIGIVTETLEMRRGTNGSIFMGWKYKVMFSDVVLDYGEEQLVLVDRMKWSDASTKPPEVKPADKSPEKK